MRKSDYIRSTAACKFENLKPKFIQYLKAYTQKHKLENIEKEVPQCFEVTNIKTGFLGKEEISYTGICVTKRFLFWGVTFDKKETAVAASQWNEISEIMDYETSEFAKMIEDHGLRFSGFVYQSGESGGWFIGLGEDDAGNKCRKLMKEMINKE